MFKCVSVTRAIGTLPLMSTVYGMPYRAAERAFGVPEATLRRWARQVPENTPKFALEQAVGLLKSLKGPQMPPKSLQGLLEALKAAGEGQFLTWAPNEDPKTHPDALHLALHLQNCPQTHTVIPLPRANP